MLADKTPHAAALRAENKHNARTEVDVGERPVSGFVKPQTQKPCSFSRARARARLTVRINGTRSTAPEAALASAPVIGGAP